MSPICVLVLIDGESCSRKPSIFAKPLTGGGICLDTLRIGA